ncbi:thrombospondin type 1 domain protein [Ancylostoma ceylanicum]|nr:thrombospondin type 1 domain protein [Ancylostoma ceylanicum]
MDTYFTDLCINVALSCSAPDKTSDVALVNSHGAHLAMAAATVNLTLSCNDKAYWVTSTGSAVDHLSCGVIQKATEPPKIETTTKFETTTEPSCASSKWAEWREWSTCTDTCGSCGTMQRFRACQKSRPECFCEGSAFEKVVCNQEVCRYPREKPCCDGFAPTSYNGRFFCMKSLQSRTVVV